MAAPGMGTPEPIAAVGPADSVDRLLAGWARVLGDLDLSPVGIVSRIERLRRIIDAETGATYAEFGLNGADFAMLATLRRLDQPDGVTQSRLMSELDLSSGTVSVRIERLSDRGLVFRASHGADRRHSFVNLTEEGRELFDRVAPAHLRTEDRLLAALDGPQRDALAHALRTLLLSLEGSAAPTSQPSLGLVVVPAHRTVELRRQLGLPDVIGLLVRDIASTGAAAEADIRVGDVLCTAGGRQLRSIAALFAAISERQDDATIELSGVRGVDTAFTTNIKIPAHGRDQTAAVVAAFSGQNAIGAAEHRI